MSTSQEYSGSQKGGRTFCLEKAWFKFLDDDCKIGINLMNGRILVSVELHELFKWFFLFIWNIASYLNRLLKIIILLLFSRSWKS